MSNIIGTIVDVKRFLGNGEAKIYYQQHSDSLITLESDRTYTVPDYQREVRWNHENMIELISDIKHGAKFLGNIILSKLPQKRYEIIDGQQRITMLLMLLAYIKSVSKGSVDVIETSTLEIESFSDFQLALSKGFNMKDFSEEKSNQIIQSDTYNQLDRYRKLWNAIEKSKRLDKTSSRDFLTNLYRCEFNVLLNTATEDSGYC